MTSNSGHTSHRKRRNYAPLIAGLSVAAAVLLLVVTLMITSGRGNNANSTAGSSTLAPSTAPAFTATPPATPSESPSASPSPTGTDPTDLSSTPPATKVPTIDSKICEKKNPPKFTAVLTSDEPVNVSEGAKFLIAPCLKKGESIWIFNFMTGEELYILDTSTSKSGVQSYTDKITGDVVVNFVLGNKACSAWIAGQDRNADYGNRIVLNDNLTSHAGCTVLSYKTLAVATAQN